jgi:lipoprotein
MKKGLLLMVLILGMLMAGCGKEKEVTTETSSVIETVNQNFTPDVFIKELLTNEKYFKKINGIEYFYPQYKELVCETFANREKPKNQMIKFCYETEEELKELKEYAIKFNETHERMKLDIENAMEAPHNKTISFGNYFPETLK